MRIYDDGQQFGFLAEPDSADYFVATDSTSSIELDGAVAGLRLHCGLRQPAKIESAGSEIDASGLEIGCKEVPISHCIANSRA